MEQEFDVEIKEVLSRVQKVKAESLDDAINKAMDMKNKLVDADDVKPDYLRPSQAEREFAQKKEPK